MATGAEDDESESPEELMIVAAEGTALGDALDPLNDPRVQDAVAERLQQLGLKITVIRIPAIGRHRRTKPDV